MRVFSSKKINKQRAVIVFACGLMLLSVAFSSVKAQNTTTESLLEDTAALIEAQQRVQENRDALAAAYDSQIVSRDSEGHGVFSPMNPGLWLLVAVLLGILLLLIAIRRSVRNATIVISSQQTHEKVVETGKRPVLVDMPARPLVQPVKVVKIKVRKIKKA